MIANTLAKRKLLVCIILTTLITLIYLPYMARQSSKLFKLRESEQQMSRSTRVLRPLAFRRRLGSPIHMRKPNHRNRVHEMYRDTIDRLLREAETFRDFFRKSHNILPWPMRKMEKLKRKSKFLIYRCDVINQCGSWSNRVQGIIASYLLASLTNRTLKVEILDSPCSVTSFLIPNIVNWSLPVPFHKMLVPDAHSNFVNFNPNISSFRKQNLKLDVYKLFPEKPKYVYISSSYYVLDKIREHVVQNRMLNWMRDLNKTEIYSAMLKFLFKPASSLKQHIWKFKTTALSSSREKLVCASVSSRSNHSAVSNLLKSFISLYASKAQYRFFIVPDSIRDKIALGTGIPKERFVTKIQNVLKDLTLNTTGVADQSRLKKCQKVEDMFSFMMFVQCDAILVNNAPAARLAAMSRGISRGAVCLSKDGKHISPKPCM